MGRLQSNQNRVFPAVAVWQDFVQLFFPRICVGCERPLLRGEHWLCSHCLLDLPATNYHRWLGNPVYERLLGRLPVTSAQAFLHFRKDSIAQRLLHELKYNGQPELGVFLGRVYGERLTSETRERWDAIVPVPLHPTRQRRRTYNQSERFATGLAEQVDAPVAQLLVREQATETQTRKDRAHRWENMQHAFCVADAAAVTGKRILLVDDVITTGATLEACGHKLWAAGCAALSIACIAEA
jgi:ComF family protein